MQILSSGGLLGARWVPFGCQGRSKAEFGRLLGALGTLLVALGPLWGRAGGGLGRSWGALGRARGALGLLLERPCALLAGPWGTKIAYPVVFVAKNEFHKNIEKKETQ